MRPAHDPRPIRRKPRGPHRPLMAAQDQQLVPARRVPDPHRFVTGRHSRYARHPARTAPPHQPSWPRRTSSSSPLAASHTRTVLSSDPLTIRAPSGENPRPTPASRGRAGPAARPRSPRPTPAPCCHRTRSRSARHLAKTPPPTPVPSWPRRTRSSFPLAASHTRTVLSIGPAHDPRAIRAKTPRPTHVSHGRAGPAAHPRSRRPTPEPSCHRTRSRSARHLPTTPRPTHAPHGRAGPAARPRSRRPTPAPSCPRTRSRSARHRAKTLRLTQAAHGRAGPAAPPRSPRPTPAPCCHRTR